MVIESQTYMVINAAVLVLAAIQILIGVKPGFLIQLMDCVGLLLSLFAAWLFSPVLAEWVAIVPASLNPARDTVLGPWVYGLMNQIRLVYRRVYPLQADSAAGSSGGENAGENSAGQTGQSAVRRFVWVGQYRDLAGRLFDSADASVF